MTSPVLIFPDFSLEFVLYTYTSGDGIGAVLSQVVEGKERVVAYASRILSRTERKYCATRRELLAVVWAAQLFRPYLYRRRFNLRTDHHCLKWLHSFKEPEGQVARWLEALAEFQYTINHRPGKQHGNADSLSCSNCKQCGLDFVSKEMEKTSCGCLSTGVQVLPFWTKVEMQEADRNLGEVIKWLASGSLPVSCPTEANWKSQSLWVQRNFLLLKDGMLYRQWKDSEGNGLHAHLQLVLLANLVSEILQGLHNSHVGGHLGARKVLEKARARFYWPGQRKDIEKWCHECAVCNSRKSQPKGRAPMEACLAKRPLERVAMDILGPLPETPRGHRYILVIGDYFPKWKEAFPLRDMEATSIARVLVNEFICHFGVPDNFIPTRERTSSPNL